MCNSCKISQCAILILETKFQLIKRLSTSAYCMASSSSSNDGYGNSNKMPTTTNNNNNSSSTLQRILLNGSTTNSSILNHQYHHHQNEFHSFIPPPPPPLPPPPQSSSSLSSISVPAFLSTLLQQPIGNGNGDGSIIDYNRLSSLTNSNNSNIHSKYSSNSKTKRSRQVNNNNRRQQSRSRSRSPSSKVSTSNDDDDDHQIVSTSGQPISNRQSSTSFGRNSLLKRLTGANHRSHQSTYPSTTTTATILLQAHQNDTHDSLAASMPLLSSYLRSPPKIIGSTAKKLLLNSNIANNNNNNSGSGNSDNSNDRSQLQPQLQSPILNSGKFE